MPVQRVAIKAALFHNEKVLIIRESAKYKEGSREGSYDLPGGRIEEGESWKAGLLREIKEEVGLTDIRIQDPILISEWFPKINGIPHHIIGIFIACETLSEKITLTADHDDAQWVNKETYKNFILHPQAKTALEKMWG